MCVFCRQGDGKWVIYNNSNVTLPLPMFFFFFLKIASSLLTTSPTLLIYFILLQRHANTSTLWALASGAYDKKKMLGFTVSWSALISGPEKLRVAFETTEEAEEWHEAFTEAISRRAAMRVGRTISSTSDASTATLDALNSNLMAAAQQPHQDTTNDTPKPITTTTTAAAAGANHTTTTAAAPTTPSRKIRAWASVLHINGISVYTEEQDENGEGGAVMVSAVVRAPPVDCFRSLVQVRKTDSLGIFAGARTVEVIDANTQVVAQRWHGSGIVGSMCAPREMVLLRTWRKDEDGTYIVLYQSTNHPAVRRTESWSWRAPVRAKVQAAGFTIAPLLPQYTSSTGGQSQECLVTLVLKADLGGALSGATLAGRLLTPFASHALRGMLEPVVASIVVLRDRVEQNRFVVRPLTSNGGQSDEYGDEEGFVIQPPDSVPVSESERRRMNRTSTMLLYRERLPLALEQQQVAERRPAAESLVLDSVVNGGGAVPTRKRTTSAEEEEAGEATTTTTSGLLLLPPPDADAWAITGTCKREFWLCPGSCGFKVRGSNYLIDRKKMLASPPMFELVAVDLLELEEPMFHICKHLPSVRHSPAPFLFCVQMMVPSSPPVSLVCTWAAPMRMMGADPAQLIAQFEREQGPCPDSVAAFFRSFTQFLSGDGAEADKARNARFKLIPNISKGSWIIKQSVGTTPVLLGQKLTTKYYRGERYFEVDVDIGASSVAASITNLVCGATKTLAIDLGVLVEGQCGEHLPEQLMGTVRIDKMDLKTAAYFDESTGRVVRPETVQGLM